MVGWALAALHHLQADSGSVARAAAAESICSAINYPAQIMIKHEHKQGNRL